MTDDLIKDEIRRHGGNLSKVARAMGLNYQYVKAKFDDEPLTRKPLVIPSGPEPEDIRTLGRTNMERYVIAVKRCANAWPAKYDQIIKEGRKSFDAGTHIMCQQTRPDGWVVLYLIPRKKPVKPCNFFGSMVEFINV